VIIKPKVEPTNVRAYLLSSIKIRGSKARAAVGAGAGAGAVAIAVAGAVAGAVAVGSTLFPLFPFLWLLGSCYDVGELAGLECGSVHVELVRRVSSYAAVARPRSAFRAAHREIRKSLFSPLFRFHEEHS
jgi:hypothetical protein